MIRFRRPADWCTTALLVAGATTMGCSSDETQSGVTPPPSEVTRIAAAGNGHTCSVRSDGQVHCWGWNSWGQLGDSTTNDSPTPIQIGDEPVWLDVAAGANHSCAIRDDRVLFCWGRNDYGQLGSGTEDDQPVPTEADSGESWANLSAGSTHSCGVTTDGGLFCWGNNVVGQVGNGKSGALQTSPSPEPIANNTSWKTVQAGDSHSCAITTAGALWCWGNNVRGQLGDGTEDNRLEPLEIVPGTGWHSVDAGYFHSCAIRDDQTMWCWGDNAFGQLGLGTMGQDDQRLTPVRVGAEDDWVHLALGDYHSCARRADNSIWCWGSNDYGQLGDNTSVTKAAPVAITSEKNWLDLASGNDHTIGMLGDESLWCWGRNTYGQLGDGSTINRSLPVSVMFE